MDSYGSWPVQSLCIKEEHQPTTVVNPKRLRVIFRGGIVCEAKHKREKVKNYSTLLRQHICKTPAEKLLCG